MIEVYVERGAKRTFAGALEWPGWCRSGRDDATALQALVEYGARYKRSVRATGLKLPNDVSELKVVERLKGNATTDFGAPGVPPKFDESPIDAEEAKRLARLLKASWRAFDAAAQSAKGKDLRKGPRGGGRDLPKIASHVMEADKAYFSKLGGPTRSDRLREAFPALVVSRARGEDPPRIPRSGSLWTPRYAVRRSAWHALDHAWEIEDRSA